MKDVLILVIAFHISVHSKVMCHSNPWEDKKEGDFYGNSVISERDPLSEASKKMKTRLDNKTEFPVNEGGGNSKSLSNLPSGTPLFGLVDVTLPYYSSDRFTHLNQRALRSPSLNDYGAGQGLSNFYTHKKNWRPDMTALGFHSDAFTGGLGSFYTMKRSHPSLNTIEDTSMKPMEVKKSPEMTANGFHSNLFSGGLGKFYTMKRVPEFTSSGFHGNMFNGGMGSFYTMKREGPRDNIFSDARGNLYTISKRIPEMTSSGFHGNMFSGGLGSFYTMKRDAEISSKE